MIGNIKIQTIYILLQIYKAIHLFRRRRNQNASKARPQKGHPDQAGLRPGRQGITGGDIGSQTVVVTADPGSAKSGANPVTFSVEDINDPAVAVTEESKFWLP